MKNEQNLSDTLEINVEHARKAVGSLFDKEDNLEEDDEEEIITGYDKYNTSEKYNTPDKNNTLDKYNTPDENNTLDKYNTPDKNSTSDKDNKPDMRQVSELFEEPLNTDEENIWPEDDYRTMGSPIRRRSSESPPKPALKVNASVPAASRMPRPRRPLSVEDEENEQYAESQRSRVSSPPPGTRAVRSRYLFIEDEDDEFTSFRQRYRERDRKTEGTRVERQQPAHEEERKLNYERDHERREMQRRRSEEQRDRPPRQGRPPRQDRAPLPDFEMQEAYAPMSMSAPIRIVVICIIVSLLAMMIFLIFRLNIVSAQLEYANERILGIPAIEEELARTQLALVAAEENLAEVMEVNIQLPLGTGSEISNEASYEYPSVNYNEESYTPIQPALPGTDRIHTVVSGDNLYRISTRHYGNGSHENIQRIMQANNITDPDNIQIGTELIIPY